jgi:hypothetical protein
MAEYLRRSLAFCGYQWLVKASDDTPEGPGPNRWGDGSENVCVDQPGALHLRITHEAGLWRCAEVVSARSFGYGRYRFSLAPGAESINENVVLGLFTWDTDPAHHHREIDIEISRWGVPDSDPGQFVVQPYDSADSLHRFAIPVREGSRATPTTHLFDWRAGRISFQSWRGDAETTPDNSSLLTSWSYSGPHLPPPGQEKVRMNLWLFRGDPPSDGREVEVIVTRFDFTP